MCGGSHPTDSHIEQVPGKEREPRHEHAMKGLEYLHALLASETFTAEYILATVERALNKHDAGINAQKALKAEQDAIDADIKKRLKDKEGIVEERALQILRADGTVTDTTVMDVKKRLKDLAVRNAWALALTNAKQELEANGADVVSEGRIYPYHTFDAAVSQEVIAAHAERLAQKEATLETLRAQLSTEARLHLENLKNELQTRSHDPLLLNALDVWGMSPDSQGGRGEHGQGFHAGIAHFFEYRRGADKLGRFTTKPTLDHFIEFSNILKSVLENPNPASNAYVTKSVYITDELGQARLMSLITHGDGLLVSAFQRPNEPMRVITAVSPYAEKQFEKDVNKELHPKDFTKLNELGKTRQQADLREYSSKI